MQLVVFVDTQYSSVKQKKTLVYYVVTDNTVTQVSQLSLSYQVSISPSVYSHAQHNTAMLFFLVYL